MADIDVVKELEEVRLWPVWLTSVSLYIPICTTRITALLDIQRVRELDMCIDNASQVVNIQAGQCSCCVEARFVCTCRATAGVAPRCVPCHSKARLDTSDENLRKKRGPIDDLAVLTSEMHMAGARETQHMGLCRHRPRSVIGWLHVDA